MNIISHYIDFIRLKGRSLAEINSGSDEVALKVDDALQAIELLKDSQLPILGGDILSVNSDTLVYAYQLWGSEYHCLNWYSEKMEKEDQVTYCNRSYIVAKNSIKKANEVSKRLGMNCYIVLVTPLC